jgi:hypothetical protein
MVFNFDMTDFVSWTVGGIVLEKLSFLKFKQIIFGPKVEKEGKIYLICTFIQIKMT